MRTMTVIAGLLLLAAGIGLNADAAADAGRVAAAGGANTAADDSRQTVPDERFLALFGEFISERLEKDPADLILSRFKVSGNQPVTAGRPDFRVFQKTRGSLKGFVRLAAMVSVDGSLENEVELSAWVDVFEAVVCTARRLKKGEVLTTADLTMTPKNISRMPPHYLTDISKAVGLTVKHDVDEGSCLKAWMLKRDPIVAKGDMVTILAALGGIRITAPGMILENGFSGDTVRVRNAMSRKKIYARVLDENTVVVDF